MVPPVPAGTWPVLDRAPAGAPSAPFPPAPSGPAGVAAKNDAGAVLVIGSPENTRVSPSRNTPAHSPMMQARVSAVIMPRLSSGRWRSCTVVVSGGRSAAVPASDADTGTALASTVTTRSVSPPAIIRGPRTSRITAATDPAGTRMVSGAKCRVHARSASAARRLTSSGTFPWLVSSSTNRARRLALTDLGEAPSRIDG